MRISLAVGGQQHLLFFSAALAGAEDLFLTDMALWGTGIARHFSVMWPYEMPNAPHRVSSARALAPLGSVPP